jgi:hypothetical protein
MKLINFSQGAGVGAAVTLFAICGSAGAQDAALPAAPSAVVRPLQLTQVRLR